MLRYSKSGVLLQTDSAGNTSAAVTKLIEVSSTLVANGDLSASDLSAVTELILNGHLTALPDTTAKLPKAINANGYNITAADTGINISNVELSNVNSLIVDAGVTLSMTAAQATLFNSSAGITLTNASTSIVSVTAGGNLAAQNLANVTLTLNADTTLPDSDPELPKEVDAGSTYKITLSESVDISSVTITDPAALEIAASKNITMEAEQHNAFSSIIADGLGQTVTLDTAGTVTGASNVENYVLAAAGSTTFTLGRLSQSVNATAGDGDTIIFDIAAGTGNYSGTVQTKSTDTIRLSADANIAGVSNGTSEGAVLAAANLTLDNDVSVTMTSEQHNGFSGTVTAGATETITLSNAGTVTGYSAIENYVLGNGDQTFTVGSGSQNVTTGTGTVVIDSNDQATLSGTYNGTSGTVSLLVTADSNLSTANLTNVTVNLDTDVDATVDYSQHAALGTGTGTNEVTLTGTAADLTGNAAIENYVLGNGDQTFTVGSGSQNVTTGTGTVVIDSNDQATLSGTYNGTSGTVSLLVTADSNLSTANLTNVTVNLDTDVDATVDYSQHAALGTGTGTNEVTLTGTAADLTGNAAIENYVLGNGDQTFTVGSGSQNVTTGTGTVVIDSNDQATLSGTYNGTSGTVSLLVTADSNLSTANLTNVTVNLDTDVDATVDYSQHAALGTGTGTNEVTLTGTAADLTGNAAIENYVLGNGDQTFTVGSGSQNVTTGTGTVVIDSNDQATLSGTYNGTSGTVSLLVTADSNLSTANLTNVTVNLDTDVDATVDYSQHAALGTGTGTNEVTLTGTAADLTGNAAIENYVLGNGDQTFTVGSGSQNVTTGTGTVVIDSNDQATLSGTYNGTSGTVSLLVTADSNLSTANLTNVTVNLDTDVDATVDYSQHAALGTGTGTNEVTLTGTAADLTGNAAIENYVLGNGDQTFTVGSGSQNVTTGTGTVVIDSNDQATLSGTYNGTSGTVSLLVTADSNLSTANLTNVTVNLDTDVDATVDYSQHAALGTGTGTNEVTLTGTAADLTGNAAIENYVLGNGDQTFTVGSGSQNVTTGTGTVVIDSNDQATLSGTYNGTSGTVSLLVTADSNLSTANLTNVTVNLDTDVDATVDYSQHAALGTGTGTNEVTLTGTAADLTGNAAIENYVLGNGDQTFTVGSGSQNVTTGTGTVVIDSNDQATLSGTYNGTSGTVSLLVTADSNLSTANLTNVTVNLDTDVDATVDYSQHAALGTGTGTNEVTLTGTAADLTGNAAIENYVLGNGDQTFTVGSGSQNVTTGTGTVVIDSNDQATLSGTYNGTSGTVSLLVTADSNLSTANLTNVTVNLDTDVDATVDYSQHAALGTGTGTNEVTLTGTAADLTGNAAIENYVLGNGDQTFTVGSGSQNVTTGTGTVVIDSNDQATLSGTYNGTSGTVSLLVTADSNLSTANLTNVTVNLDTDVDATVDYSQHAALGTGTGTNEVTLTGTAADLTGNAAIENYVLGNGDQTFTVGSGSQNVTTGTGTVVIDSNDQATLSGTYNGTSGTVSLLVTADSNLSTANLTNVTVNLDTDVDATVDYSQHAALGTGTGTNEVTLTGTAADLTGNAAIENYVLGNGDQTFTVGSGSQNVTTGTGTVVIDSNDQATLSGTYNGTSGTVSLLVTADSNLSTANLTNVTVNLDTDVDATVDYSQHAALGTGTGTNEVTLTGTAADLTGNAAIENYVLGNGDQTFTVGSGSQNVTTGTGTVVIDSNDQATLSGIYDGTNGNVTINISANANIANATFTSIEAITLEAGVTLTGTRDQLTGGLSITGGSALKILSDDTTDGQYTLDAAASLDISDFAVPVSFVEGDDQTTVTTTLVLGAGSTLKLTAVQAKNDPGAALSISDGGTATVTVEELENLTTANLTGINVGNLNAEIAVSGSDNFTGNLNNAALLITSADSTPVLDLTGAGSVDSIDFNNLELEVVLSTTQYTENDGLSVTNTTNAQTIQVVNESGSAAAVTQLAGIETYKLNASTAADNITFNTLETDDSVNLTRSGHADAVVTISVDGAATFDGTWSGFNAGDTLAIDSGAATINVEGVNAGSSIGGIDTITVDTGDTLQAAAAQLDGAGLTGAGTTVVRSLDSSGANLSSVNSTTVSLDVTSGNASVGTGFQLLGGRAYNVTGDNTLNLTAATSLGLNATSSFVIAASTGLIADAADLDQVATSSDGTTTVRSLDASTADLSELNSTTVTLDIESASAEVGVGFDLAGGDYNVIGTGELDLTNATLSTSASYDLGSGTNLRIKEVVQDFRPVCRRAKLWHWFHIRRQPSGSGIVYHRPRPAS